jgi:hypothetical protein
VCYHWCNGAHVLSAVAPRRLEKTSNGGLRFHLRVEQSSMTNAALTRVSALTNTHYARPDGGGVFGAISFLQETHESWYTTLASDAGDVKEGGIRGNFIDGDGVDVDDGWVRQWLWFHHIYHMPKRRHIVSHAKSLSLSGLSMHGKPGIVVVEGPARDVKKYTAGLRELNWKKMASKLRQPIEKDARAFGKFTEYAHDLPLLVQMCLKLDLQSELERCLGMKIRDPGGATAHKHKGSSGDAKVKSRK